MNKFFLLGFVSITLLGCMTEPTSDENSKYGWEQAGALALSDTVESGQDSIRVYAIQLDTVKSAPVESLYIAAGRQGFFICNFSWWLGSSENSLTYFQTGGYSQGSGYGTGEGRGIAIFLSVPRAHGFTHYRLEADCSENISDTD